LGNYISEREIVMNNEQNQKLLENFRSIVEEAAEGVRSVERVSVDGWHVNAEFRSNSGKQTWECDLYFEDGSGGFTKEYSRGISGQPNSSGPWILADEILERVKDFLGE